MERNTVIYFKPPVALRRLPIDLCPIHFKSPARDRQVGVAYVVGVAGVT